MDYKISWLTLWLDVWTSSIWWALIGDFENKKKLIDGGVRIFHEPRDSKTKETLNTVRREKRWQRRVIRRRNERIEMLKKHLVEYWLFPKETKEQQKYYSENPYELRAKWVSERLDLYDLWRSLLHIWQRRGFQSNRKVWNTEEKSSKFKTELSELSKVIGDKDFWNWEKCKTLWQYFYVLIGEWKDVRWKHTRRDMYEHEFNLIMQKQKTYHTSLTDEVINQLKRDIFFQNPLKSQKELIWECLYFAHRQRAHSLSLWSQEFRIWQDINNLKYKDTNLQYINLDYSQRMVLFQQMNTLPFNKDKRKENISFETVRKLLNLPKFTQFNLERSYKDWLTWNYTFSKLYEKLWEHWITLDRGIQDEIVRYLIDIQSSTKLRKVLEKKFKNILDNNHISLLLELDFSESRYTAISEKAIKLIIPLMHWDINKVYRIKSLPETRRESIRTILSTRCDKDWVIIDTPITQSEAIKLLWLNPRNFYKENKDNWKEKDFIPDLRNPSVNKSLFEARKIAKAIKNTYWIPSEIKIEVGTSLQMWKDKLEKYNKKISENKKQNDLIKKELVELWVVDSRENIIKLKLWKECFEKWQSCCPYTWKPISKNQVFWSEIDIEHIIPYSRSLDDSFTNKTLCYSDFNRTVKKEFTPYEIFSGDKEKFDDFKKRIAKYSDTKRNNFLRENIVLEDFIKRQLIDTQYVSKELGKFLNSYFWENVQFSITKWQLTATLRYSWAWNRFLWDAWFSEEVKATKNRWDHRHHFIDAIVIALTNQGMLQKASELSRDNKLSDKEKIFGKLKPSEEFEKQLQEKLEKIIISFAPKHKVNWALHNETGYWLLKKETVIKLKKSNDGMVLENGKWVFIKRVPLDEKFEVKNVVKIYDKWIRELVRNHLSANEDNPKLAFPKVWDWKLFHKDGKTPIKSVRIYEKKSLEWIYDYKWEWNLFYETWSNHHVEILEHTRKTNKDGTPLRKWIFVTMLEAATRASKKLPVVQRKWPWKDGEELLEAGDWKFVMSLMIDDMVEINDKIYVASTLSGTNNIMRFFLHTDSAREKEVDWKLVRKMYEIQSSPAGFKWKKIQVSPLGIKSIAND